ncbi:MAG: hypothetical protein KGD64_01070 [Candidatus Heimdallarchaeota archaeon]|nr:hypothetical protein [Candidatus Heimdallarchaeota archaeon]
MKRYFEGWYFKIVDKDENVVFAIIPGVSFEKDGTAHCFIQFFDGKEVIMHNIKYDIEQFQYSKKRFEVKIGNNIFTSKKIVLEIDSEDIKVKGTIELGDLSPWPVKFFNPGAMGPFRLVPFMECYHGVLSFDHKLRGKLDVNETSINFTDGRGYIEKDYGKSFPSYYLWMQSNHFPSEGTSIMVSLANIPWLGSSFDGFIVGFLNNGHLYRFATYTGAKLTKLKISEKTIITHFSDRKYRLEVVAHKAEGVDLLSPKGGSMTGRILESITAELQVKLIKIRKNQETILYEGRGRNAGLDIGGKVEKIEEIG